ncbi:hypothetical protein [Nonomuraea soli]|uniref:Uncharacterized protein n=1 Tax=Nonomuraea soli TaxID=1032476 RepID=A0A7W0HWB6_9ACTN|nr:hypothetical protein [Nonomuraea soli]MBA2897656.1 hypothetical protein [Nonomuraea soli]
MFHTSAHQPDDTTSTVSTPVASPSSSLPLDVAGHAFALLMRGPQPLSVDGAALREGLPARPIPLDELRAILLHRSCSRTTRDHVWRHLIEQARTVRGAWMVAAVALARPMLGRLVTALATKLHTDHSEHPDRLARMDQEDLEAEVLVAFMEALIRVKLTWSHPLLRLSRLTQLAVLRTLTVEQPRLLDDPTLLNRAEASLQTLAYPAGHPDLLLAQAVAEEVITSDEAELIGFTRLEGIPLSAFCRRRGLLYCTVLKRRQRAENALYQAFLKPAQ